MVGISHKTAPVAVRERFAFASRELPSLLAGLSELHPGVAVLSTCNRTEVYISDREAVRDPRPVVALLSALKGGATTDGAPFTALAGQEAVSHLMRVAAGIESMVVGESEILGQVRAAFTAATAAETHTPALSRLFHAAIRVGRAARNETAIGRYPVSISSTAVALARMTLGHLADKTVLVVGAGEAGKLTAENIAGGGIGRMLVTSRNPDRTGPLAESLGGTAMPFARLGEGMREADIVISSTAAQEFVIDAALTREAMAGRAARPMLLVDIAVPRDIDPAVREVPGVHLYDIDELQSVAERNHHLRRQEVAAVERIVNEHAARYMAWLRTQDVLPTVAALRERAEAVRAAEVERTVAKLELSEADRQRIEAMTGALVKKLLHDPIAALKDPADGERYVQAVRDLFALDDAPADAGGDED